MQAIAPRSAPIFPALPDGNNFSDYLEGLRASNDTTKSAMLAIIYQLATTAGGDPDAELTQNCSAMFDVGVAAALITAFDAAPADVNNLTDSDKIISRSDTQVDTSVQWICDLVNASKKKEIDGENVEGYFSSLGRSDIKGGAIATMINKVANFLPDNISSATFREGLTNNVWNSYHTSRVSTGKLLYGMRQVFLDLEIFEAGGASDVAIIASSTNPHDVQLSYAIPKNLVGYASLFFEVGGIDVGQWYQGAKAESELPAAKVKAIKSVFKKYLSIKNNISSIEDTDNITALNAAVGDSFW